jgi:hypothetical protein
MGGKTFAGKTAGASQLAASSRSAGGQESAPPPWELFSDQRRQEVIDWLQEVHSKKPLAFDLQSSEYFLERHIQQLSTLHFDHRGLQLSQIKDFIEQTGELVDESIRNDYLQQAGVNIAALAAHLEPGFQRQKFLERVDHLDRAIDFDSYADDILQQLKYSDPNGQEIERQVDAYINEHGLSEDDRSWVDDDIHSAIIEDPRDNPYYQLDLEQYDQWLVEQYHESLGRALEDCQAPDWFSILVHQDEINRYPEQLVEALSGYQLGPAAGVDNSSLIEFYRSADEPRHFFFDSKAETFYPAHRVYRLDLGSGPQMVEISEKRNADGQGLLVNTESGMAIRAACSAQNDYNHQPVVRAFFDREGQEPVKIKVTEKNVTDAGSLEAWAINELRQRIRSNELQQKLTADDPNEQVKRLLEL